MRRSTALALTLAGCLVVSALASPPVAYAAGGSLSVAEVEAAVRAANSALANGLVNRDLRRCQERCWCQRKGEGSSAATYEQRCDGLRLLSRPTALTWPWLSSRRMV